MGATLNTAVEMNAYVLTDRASWAHFQNRGDLLILVEGDQASPQSLWQHSGQPGEMAEGQGGGRARLA